MSTEQEQESETIKKLREARDKCASDLKKLRQSLKGMESKVAQTEAKLEMADEMLLIAKRAAVLETL
jgi:phage shock protein A